MEVKGKKGVEPFTQDEHPRETTLEKLGKLPAVFKENGCVSAGSASVSIQLHCRHSSVLDRLLLSFQFYAWWFNYPGSLIHTKLGVARLIMFEGRWGMHD